MEVVMLQTEAFDQFRRDTFKFFHQLLTEERQKSTVEWLDNKEAAALLKVCSRTMQNWRDEGLLGFSQVGSKIYYSREDIDRMLQKHRREPFKALA
ncbi:helix-turn-helix domain-containing protein [Hymenobacter sp. NST-14]|uniref:helix-turn-helix domain-containing protein n=1 Tax=Hymenobacter piscis TaxID=2839984 RepID=UPI001C010D8F|nr:helix-turn-helix domain-containing protein [Hymenobacter piscis]MBT9391789.1 helix-turn-helix domain-containing protein [Hymenobacter piscis]